MIQSQLYYTLSGKSRLSIFHWGRITKEWETYFEGFNILVLLLEFYSTSCTCLNEVMFTADCL